MEGLLKVKVGWWMSEMTSLHCCCCPLYHRHRIRHMIRLAIGARLVQRSLFLRLARRALSTAPFEDVKLPTLEDLYLKEGDNGEL